MQKKHKFSLRPYRGRDTQKPTGEKNWCISRADLEE